MGLTLFDKIWDSHTVRNLDGGRSVLYIDRHYIHEVTSPVAFGGLRERGLKIFRPDQTTATADHNTPTINQHLPVEEELSRLQLEQFDTNCREFALENYYPLNHPKNGIVHVVGPELGFTQPGMTIVCGDSHTSTHGAFGAIAFGIGTSEVEMVFASQCIVQPKPRKMRITVSGELRKGVTAKDIALYIISKISTSGGTGYFIEFAGTAIKGLSMEGRMTLCNMSIECGARGGIVAPDQTTYEYLKGRPNVPQGEEWFDALSRWSMLYSDVDAVFDKQYRFEAEDIPVMITYGTNPGMGMPIDGKIPVCKSDSDTKALEYMGLKEGQQLLGMPIDYVFLGSCTNGRIEDFRAFASVVKGKRKADNVVAWLVPGSHEVEALIKEEGLLDILTDAGFELRQPGCSACLAMNTDKVPAGKYAVSTSNRNFEGRQGPGARTLLASPIVAAHAAIAGIISIKGIGIRE